MLFKPWISFVVVYIFLPTIRCKNDYSNHTLYRVIPRNEKQLKFIQNLDKFYKDVNFWTEIGRVNFPVELTLGPHDKKMFEIECKEYQMALAVVLKDVQDQFNQQAMSNIYRSGELNTFDWNTYHVLEDIYKWLQDLATTHPGEVSLSNVGLSSKFREIKAVRVLRKGSTPRSTVIVEGGIHGREWISPAVVTYILDKIVNVDTTLNDPLAKMALLYEWYFVPVLNPDGYDHTQKQDRMWSKNLRSFHNSSLGVDLNRNFGINHYNDDMTPNKQTFPGDKAFSEEESAAMAKFIQSKSDKLEYYLSFHAYGELMLIPYEFSGAHLDNYEEMKIILQEAAKVIKLKSNRNTNYKIGLSYEILGAPSIGTSASWVKRAFRVPYVATIALPPAQSATGYALSTDMIMPVCEETMAGFVNILTPRKNFTKLGPFLTEKNEGCKVRHQDNLLQFECPTALILRFSAASARSDAGLMILCINLGLIGRFLKDSGHLF